MVLAAHTGGFCLTVAPVPLPPPEYWTSKVTLWTLGMKRKGWKPTLQVDLVLLELCDLKPSNPLSLQWTSRSCLATSLFHHLLLYYYGIPQASDVTVVESAGKGTPPYTLVLPCCWALKTCSSISRLVKVLFCNPAETEAPLVLEYISISSTSL